MRLSATPADRPAVKSGAGNDSYRLYVRGAGGNHGANLTRFSEADRGFALAELGEWLGVSTAARSAAQGSPLDAHGFDEPTRWELFLR